jgi:hypothetical protein
MIAVMVAEYYKIYTCVKHKDETPLNKEDTFKKMRDRKVKQFLYSGEYQLEDEHKQRR